ncbi:MAG: hypothetical protein KDE23_03290 [Caldilinea sp.]|nr:hypothetical protein [Caldilinea sp.]
MTTDLSHSYIARCKCGCGGILFATVDNPQRAHDIAADVADCIRDGLHIERVPSEVVRTTPWGCQSEQAGQLDLFTAEAAP